MRYYNTQCKFRVHETGRPAPVCPSSLTGELRGVLNAVLFLPNFRMFGTRKNTEERFVAPKRRLQIWISHRTFGKNWDRNVWEKKSLPNFPNVFQIPE